MQQRWHYYFKQIILPGMNSFCWTVCSCILSLPDMLWFVLCVSVLGKYCSWICIFVRPVSLSANFHIAVIAFLSSLKHLLLKNIKYNYGPRLRIINFHRKTLYADLYFPSTLLLLIFSLVVLFIKEYFAFKVYPVIYIIKELFFIININTPDVVYAAL